MKNLPKSVTPEGDRPSEDLETKKMCVPFICFQCGYREERDMLTGPICPECGRCRLVAYCEHGPTKTIRMEREYHRLKPKRLKLKDIVEIYRN